MFVRYGITWERWNEMLIAQAGRCGLCGKPMMGKNDPAVDHDHETGKVRGLLHVGCNVGLRCVEDDEFRRKATVYLSQTQV